MIEVLNLTKRYRDVLAVDRLNFSIKKGEILGFLGPNGAGKTTTMRIVTGFQAPTSGSVTVEGFDVFDNPIQVKRRIGYLPEVPPLYPEMKVFAYLEYVARLKGLIGTSVKKEVDRVAGKCGLTPVGRRVIKHLSKGFRQRVGIAQALLGSPAVLIMDEPTIGLDPAQIREIRGLIRELAEEHTIILSTHILPEVTMVCNRVIIINQGRIVAEDTIENLTASDDREQHVVVEVRKPSPEVTSRMRGVAGVKEVKLVDSCYRAVIEAGSEESAEKLAAMAIDGGLGLVELKTETPTLEDIFLRLVAPGEYGLEADEPARAKDKKAAPKKAEADGDEGDEGDEEEPEGDEGADEAGDDGDGKGEAGDDDGKESDEGEEGSPEDEGKDQPRRKNKKKRKK